MHIVAADINAVHIQFSFPVLHIPDKGYHMPRTICERRAGYISGTDASAFPNLNSASIETKQPSVIETSVGPHKVSKAVGLCAVYPEVGCKGCFPEIGGVWSNHLVVAVERIGTVLVSETV